MNHQETDQLTQLTDQLLAKVGGELTAENMNRMNADDITLIAYRMLRDEVMEGGFIQLIHNGYGPFIFINPLAKAIRLMGKETDDENTLRDLQKLIYDGRAMFEHHAEALTKDCTDEEFMALYEQFPEFDELDDEFVDREEEFTSAMLRRYKALNHT